MNQTLWPQNIKICKIVNNSTTQLRNFVPPFSTTVLLIKCTRFTEEGEGEPHCIYKKKILKQKEKKENSTASAVCSYWCCSFILHKRCYLSSFFYHLIFLPFYLLSLLKNIRQTSKKCIMQNWCFSFTYFSTGTNNGKEWYGTENYKINNVPRTSSLSTMGCELNNSPSGCFRNRFKMNYL